MSDLLDRMSQKAWTLEQQKVWVQLQQLGFKSPDLAIEAGLGLVLAAAKLRQGEGLTLGRLEDGDCCAFLVQLPPDVEQLGTNSPDFDTAAVVEMASRGR